MIKRAMTWTLALGMLLPAAAQAQQDPALVGQGAQVYSNNCGRCHNARSSTERTDADWATIVNHMRARANLTKAQARAVLAYLQATNLPEGTAPSGDADDMQEARAPAGPVVAPAALVAVLARLPLPATAGREHRTPGSGGR